MRSGDTLLFVIGASPQIITETASTLLANGANIGRLVVLTTTVGRDYIDAQLFGPGRHWRRLTDAYPAARRIRFSRASVRVLTGRRGAELADVRSADDSESIAEQISATVAELTADGRPPLQASIAGGRKTMGYLLATAMMLHGRPQDQLLHVLVEPAEMEGTDFFFLPPPRRRPRVLRVRAAGGSEVQVNGSDVRVDVVSLPFVRLRAISDLRGRSFAQLVRECQADLDALAQPRLELDSTGRTLRANGRPVRLPPRCWEIYAMLAERRLAGCGRPDCAGCASCFVSAGDIPRAFRDQLRARLEARESYAVGRTWGARAFRSEVSKTNRTIRAAMRNASAPFEIRSWGRRGAVRYGIAIPASAITWAHV